MDKAMQCEVYKLLATLLEYPGELTPSATQEVIRWLQPGYPYATHLLQGFQEFVESSSLAQLEELYTQTFDFGGTCCLYIGHHLFGENYQRSWFMACLNHEYRQRGLVHEHELPDHTALVLRFLAMGPQDEFSNSLACEGLVPALGKMITEFDKARENPYRQVIQALLDLVNGGSYPMERSPVTHEMED